MSFMCSWFEMRAVYVGLIALLLCICIESALLRNGDRGRHTPFIIGPPNGPVLFCLLASVVVVVCWGLQHSTANLQAASAASQAMTSCRLQSSYSSMVTLHGGPVWLRPVRATPCWILFASELFTLLLAFFARTTTSPSLEILPTTLAQKNSTNIQLAGCHLFTVSYSGLLFSIGRIVSPRVYK